MVHGRPGGPHSRVRQNPGRDGAQLTESMPSCLASARSSGATDLPLLGSVTARVAIAAARTSQGGWMPMAMAKMN